MQKSVMLFVFIFRNVCSFFFLSLYTPYASLSFDERRRLACISVRPLIVYNPLLW